MVNLRKKRARSDMELGVAIGAHPTQARRLICLCQTLGAQCVLSPGMRVMQLMAQEMLTP